MEQYHASNHNYGSGSQSTHHHYYTDHHYYAKRTPPTDPPQRALPSQSMPTPPGSPRSLNPDSHEQSRSPHLPMPNSGRETELRGLLEVREPRVYAHIYSASTPASRSVHQTQSETSNLPHWFTSRMPGPMQSAADDAHVSILDLYANSRVEAGLWSEREWQRSETRATRGFERAVESGERREGVCLRDEERGWLKPSREKKGRKSRRTSCWVRGESSDVEWKQKGGDYKESGRIRREVWIRRF